MCVCVHERTHLSVCVHYKGHFPLYIGDSVKLHPLTVPCLVPGHPEAHSLASASPPCVCVASAAWAPLLATPVALALPLTLLLVELKA